MLAPCLSSESCARMQQGNPDGAATSLLRGSSTCSTNILCGTVGEGWPHVRTLLSTAALLDKRGQSNGWRGRVLKAILEAGAVTTALSSAGYTECILVFVH